MNWMNYEVTEFKVRVLNICRIIDARSNVSINRWPEPGKTRSERRFEVAVFHDAQYVEKKPRVIKS